MNAIKITRNFECYVFYVNLHYPNQFICSKKSYLSYTHILHKLLYMYIMSTYAHPIIIILSVQKKAQNETHRLLAAVEHAAIFCEVSAKPNYQTTKEMNMIE